MRLRILIIFFIFLTGYSNFSKTHSSKKYFINKKMIENTLYNWHNFIKLVSYKYKVDEKLIKSIIYVESSGNPYATSTSNAIGLMQIKPSSAGAEVYRLNGKKGRPSIKELYNPKINIDIGTNYINFLQRKLIGIKNKDVMRYATIVSYVNGQSALFKLFSKSNKKTIAMINSMTKESFCEYIKKNIHQSKLIII